MIRVKQGMEAAQMASRTIHTIRWLAAVAAGAGLLSSCGGGGGSGARTGAELTYLTVEAQDGDADRLHYQWRATAGTIENRDAPETVWRLPDGPGLHFAYVKVSDGKGGYVEQQYAVSSDALETSAPARPDVQHVAPASAATAGGTARLVFFSRDDTRFAPPNGGTAQPRTVFQPDVQVRVLLLPGQELVFSGTSDASGELNLPELETGANYELRCATPTAPVFAPCGSLGGAAASSVVRPVRQIPPTLNLRLYGHVGFSDGGVCGVQDELFALSSSATVQLLADDETPLAAPVRVNRYGDYAFEAAAPVHGPLKLRVQCESLQAVVPVPASPDPAGYIGSQAVELSHSFANRRPRIRKMVANGPDGNVRGQMVEVEDDAPSLGLPGAEQFLTFKGKDTRRSACMYYRAFGAVRDCDDQGNMLDPISFQTWKRQHRFGTHAQGNTEARATYVNKMDLNLVRRMVATQVADDHVAFYVCNSPGPEGRSRAELEDTLRVALDDENEVACVAMEWSVTPGTHGDQPYTKFLTFGPDGRLLPSVNLDGRGEKYMPGACVACHGGSRYGGRFPERGNPSPYLGSTFLPFDTANFLFSERANLTEAAQAAALKRLNDLVLATSPTTATQNLIAGWYAHGGTDQNHGYVPDVWRQAANQPGGQGAETFYREVIATSCRTCHVAMKDSANWDLNLPRALNSDTPVAHVCGGTADVSVNASMPNALVSYDRLLERTRDDPALAQLLRTFLGCDAPADDPVYPKR